ncbi:hypothetical protein F3Y22_tig00021103pilonHSYRG00007 [Hibiscus syriacus]|uniref:Reverse transcriptase zinc-binding domain-containing protein n=1 Tax=Hibiscus syriacus TaxID=106335 RepID=A0A6A3BZ27_HIBSY|nr:hypothetical protein F3Y22_tig00021103pilonHSYRG00007 [Hibiscus syriacus]
MFLKELISGLLKSSLLSAREIRGRKENVEWHKIVWFPMHIPKHSLIAWMSILERLPTADNLVRMRIGVDEKCRLCGVVIFPDEVVIATWSNQTVRNLRRPLNPRYRNTKSSTIFKLNFIWPPLLSSFISSTTFPSTKNPPAKSLPHRARAARSLHERHGPTRVSSSSPCGKPMKRLLYMTRKSYRWDSRRGSARCTDTLAFHKGFKTIDSSSNLLCCSNSADNSRSPSSASAPCLKDFISKVSFAGVSSFVRESRALRALVNMFRLNDLKHLIYNLEAQINLMTQGSLDSSCFSYQFIPHDINEFPNIHILDTYFYFFHHWLLTANSEATEPYNIKKGKRHEMGEAMQGIGSAIDERSSITVNLSSALDAKERFEWNIVVMPSGRPTRSPCLPGELQEIVCACTSQHAGHPRPSDRGHPRASEAIREHPRPSERAMRGQPSELCEGIRGKPSEGRSPGVHGDLQGRPEGMATYVLGRACDMQHVHSLCLSKGRSPGVHGGLQDCTTRSSGVHGDLRSTL